MNAFEIQLWMNIARIIEIILMILIVIIINHKFRDVPYKSRPLLHLLFLIGISSWAVSTLLDLSIYLVVPLSFDLSIPVLASGYDFRYPSLVVANLMKNLLIFGIFLTSLCFLFAADTIQYGEAKTRLLMKKPLRYIIFAIFMTLSLLSEGMGVQVTADNIIIGTIGNSFGQFVKIIFPIIIYCIASFRLSRVLRQTQNGESNYRKSVKFIMWGISLLAFSYIWYIGNRILSLIIVSIQTNMDWYFIVAFVLHSLWIICPILLYFGLRNPINAENS